MALSAAYIRSRLHYEPDTGVLRWKARPVSATNPQRRCDLSWNTQHAGEITGYLDPRYGYSLVNIGGRPYPAHRLIWVIVHGRWPAEQIDHINCDRSDNRLCNLREATQVQNAANKPVRRDNRSGLKGVQYHGQTGRWRARIKVNGRTQSLGLHDSPVLAHEAYIKAARQAFGEYAYGAMA